MEYGHPWEEEWARAYANREERMAQAERDRWMAKPKRVIRGNYWPSKADRADLRVVS